MQVIKRTTGVCPQCLTKVPATVFRLGDEVHLKKVCPEHGDDSALIAGDGAFYWSQGPDGGGCGDGGCALTNHSCTLMFEITDHCNLTCPTCFAGSTPAHSWFMPLEVFEARLDKLLAAGKRDADIVQLSGGEPTLHPEIERMVALCFERGVSKVYINTNGIRVANDPAFCEFMSQYAGRLQLYLQFDGFRRTTFEQVRGAAGLGAIKAKAVANAVAAGVFVMPVMAVARDINLDEIGQVVRFCLEHHPNLNTLILQPAFYAGRYTNDQAARRMTTGDIVAAVEAQTNGLFAGADFGPIPCSDPNCFAMAVALKSGDRFVPVSRYFPRYDTWSDPGVAQRVATFADRLPQNLMETLSEDALVDQLLDLLSGVQDNAEGKGDALTDYRSWFIIGIKPFMDAHTYDQDRVDACCTHVVDRGGNPVSLCEYNTLRRPRGLL